MKLLILPEQQNQALLASESLARGGVVKALFIAKFELLGFRNKGWVKVESLERVIVSHTRANVHEECRASSEARGVDQIGVQIAALVVEEAARRLIAEASRLGAHRTIGIGRLNHKILSQICIFGVRWRETEIQRAEQSERTASRE